MSTSGINNLNQSQNFANSSICTTAKVAAIVGSVTAVASAVASAILWASNNGLISLGISFVSLPPMLPIALCTIGASVALISIIYLCIKKSNSQINPKPEIQVEPSVRYPLLEKTKGAYDLQLFTKRPLDEDIYAGGNRIEISNSDGETLALPRTLYHILFIYFCFESNIDTSQFPLLDIAFHLGSKENLDPATWFDGELKNAKTLHQFTHNKTALEVSKQNLHAKILTFFKDRGLDKLSWKETKNLIDELTLKFEAIYNQKNDILSDISKRNLWENFYIFCFNATSNGHETFKSLVTQALALEWTASPNSEIFYRTSHLTKDNIVTNDNASYSLSFSSSLFSGIVFEGRFGGTCTYSYYTQSLLANPTSENKGKQLYALEIPASKLNKYFFSPPFKDHELLPLTAHGEFSHPRLKFFGNAEGRVMGVMGGNKCANEVAKFSPTDKIPDRKSYEAKVMKLFQKNIRLLNSAAEIYASRPS